MSNFWRSPESGLVINLSYIVGIERSSTDSRFSIISTTCPGLTFMIKVGREEQSLLEALGLYKEGK